MTMLPKPDAYFVKSMFSEEPLVHIGIIEKSGGDTQWNGINVATQRLSENWNRNRGEQLSLYTYTNVDEVELLLNGRSPGVKKRMTLIPNCATAYAGMLCLMSPAHWWLWQGRQER